MFTVIRKHVLKNALVHGEARLKAVLPKVIGELPESRNDIKGLVKKINKVISEVNKLSHDEILSELESLAPELLEKKEEEGLKDLPNVNGRVVMRLAPFPSGALHLGNIRGMILNDEYVKRYGGKLILVIDDTIGSEVKPVVKDAYKLIPEALKWLGINFDSKIIYKSDRLDLYYKYGEQLLRQGAAYVCDCPTELIKDYRAKGIECSHRHNSIKDNLKKWQLMLEGHYKEGSVCVRLKTNMKDKDPAFRDRVLFRVSDRVHPRVGSKFHVWPMLEMSWAVDDMLLGVTHIIRGKELMIEGRMQNFIWDLFGYEKRPVIKYIGLFRIEGAKISKSKSRQEVESGVYSGWDDPRTWSIQSLRRRGFRPEAIRDFILSLGFSLTEIKTPVESLYTFNRRLIDDSSLRYFFVKDPVKLVVSGCPEKKVIIPLHPRLKRSRSYVINEGVNEFWISGDDVKLLKSEGLVRLKDALNVDFVSAGKVVKAVYSKNQSEVYKIRKVQFVINGVDCSVLRPDGVVDVGLCEQYCSRVSVGDVIQFERYGFVRKEGKGKYIYTHN